MKVHEQEITLLPPPELDERATVIDCMGAEVNINKDQGG